VPSVLSSMGPCWLPSKTDTPDKIEYDALTKEPNWLLLWHGN
jgi:hypothetical protein